MVEISSEIEILEVQVEAVLEEMWRMMEPSYKENYFRFVWSTILLLFVDDFRRAEESLQLEGGSNKAEEEQRPKKSELSGWQLSTRKNFPDEVRKSFSRQKKCA